MPYYFSHLEINILHIILYRPKGFIKLCDLPAYKPYKLYNGKDDYEETRHGCPLYCPLL